MLFLFCFVVKVKLISAKKSFPPVEIEPDTYTKTLVFPIPCLCNCSNCQGLIKESLSPLCAKSNRA